GGWGVGIARGGCVCWRGWGAVVTWPLRVRLVCQQFPGSWRALRSARSPLVSLAKDPLWSSSFPATSLPHASKKQNPGDAVPPSQWGIGGGVSVSGNGTTKMPQAPLFATRLLRTWSLRPPAITTPVPTGPSAAVPDCGTFGLLLSCTKLSRNRVHDRDRAVGQAPSWGDGASSLFWLFVTIPALLPSHSECSRVR